MLDLYNTTWQIGCCKTFLAAVRASGLTPVVRSVRSVTLLAPTDDAFSLLPAGYVNHLLSPVNDSRLRDLVAMHLIASAEQLAARDRVQTVLGPWLDTHSVGGMLRVESAGLFQRDIPATNGVLHIIDRVLLPASLRADCRHSGIDLPARTAGKNQSHCAAFGRRPESGPTLMTDWIGDQPVPRDETQ